MSWPMRARITDVTGAFIASHGGAGFGGAGGDAREVRRRTLVRGHQGRVHRLFAEHAQCADHRHGVGAGCRNIVGLRPVARAEQPGHTHAVESRRRTISAHRRTPRARGWIDLAAQGRPITLLEYPDTDHGIVRFETAADGKRTAIGYAPGYYQAVLDWARTGRLDGAYGDGRIFDKAGATGALTGGGRAIRRRDASAPDPAPDFASRRTDAAGRGAADGTGPQPGLCAGRAGRDCPLA